MQKINSAKMVLKYSRPANVSCAWEGSLPIGNGRVGALIQGGVRYEKIMLTDSRSSWLGSVGVLPDISDKMKEVRRLVEAKNQTMAGLTIEKAFETKKYTPTKACPLPLCDLVVEQNIVGKNINSFVRQVNMDNAECSVCFTDSGTKIDRSCFVSYADNMFYYEIQKNGNNLLNLEVGLVPHDLRYIAFNGKVSPALEEVRAESVGNFLIFSSMYEGVYRGVVAKVFLDGKATAQDNLGKIKIENAESVLIIAKTFVGKNRDKEIQEIKATLTNIKSPSYERAFKLHNSEYAKRNSKAELEISTEKDAFVDKLVANFTDESTLIFEKLFNFGKYLNVCGLMSAMNPMFVTGLWSYSYCCDRALADSCCSLPALFSASTILGQDEKLLDLINYFIKYSDDLKKNAFRVYKSKGFFVPFYYASGTGLVGSTSACDISVIVGGAIIANMFYDYFLLTKDIRFLRNDALPFMCEVAKFYMNYLYLDANGSIVSCPSFSPFGKSKYFEKKNVGVYSSCPQDFAIIRALLSNIINASNTYAISLKEVVGFQKFLNMLPLPKVTNGILNEYSDDDNSSISAGFLQFYPVFGTRNITAQSNLSSIAPYLNSVVNKIDKSIYAQNIISLGRLAEVSSILGHGDASIKLLQIIVKNFMSENLITMEYDKNNLCALVGSENYFNIAGNQLILSAISNCFVLGSDKNISIMPSKPTSWISGKISGIITPQNTIVDIIWDDRKGTAIATIKALRSTNFNVVLNKGVKKVKGYNINPVSPFIENINLASGKSVVLEIKY